MITLLVWFFVLCLVFGLLWYAAGFIPSEPFKQIARVGLIVIFVIILIVWLVPDITPPPPPWRHR